MYRGTTPTLIFNLPFSLQNLTEIYITFEQGGRLSLEKTIDNVDIDEENNSVSVRLSQEETLAFSEFMDIEIQLRVKMADETALASNIIKTDIHKILKDGVI